MESSTDPGSLERPRSLNVHELSLLALEEARGSVRSGSGGPFGAIIVDNAGTVIGRGRNTVLSTKDPTAHAEMNAIREASKTHGPHLDGCVLFTTSAPCMMCSGAISWSRIQDVHWAVPRSTAKGFGFADGQERDIGARPIPTLSAISPEVEELFRAWKDSSGKIY